jgi:hypothetical protein
MGCQEHAMVILKLPLFDFVGLNADYDSAKPGLLMVHITNHSLLLGEKRYERKP